MPSLSSPSLRIEVNTLVLLPLLHTRATLAVPRLDGFLPLLQGYALLLLAGLVLRVALIPQALLQIFAAANILCRGFTKDVSPVVGAPWRCGVLTTQGGIAGIGLGHLLRREHYSTPRVEWRLLAC